MSIVIKVEDLSKQYRLGHVGSKTLSHDVNRWWHRVRGKEDPYLKVGQVNDRTIKGTSQYVWSLKDINFEIVEGSVTGIIGRNGAGKSTLLKVLSKVTTPTKGEVKIKGRIASLLEVGTGFHPDLSGRDNIFLNGAILGMTKHEIKRKFDEIVEFAGVERYIDTPVKRYSSGMYVRLAFAVAAHLEPDILIVDEVLAVGDAEFQKKCLGKMKDVSTNDGRTVLFVSHQMASIEALCDSAILLKNGSIDCIGETSFVVNEYLNSRSQQNRIPLIQRKDREGRGNIRLTSVEVEEDSVVTGKDLTVTANYTCLDHQQDIRIKEFGISIWNDREVKLISLSSTFKGELEDFPIPLNGSVTCKIKSLPLIEGSYIVNFFVGSQFGLEDYVTDCTDLTIEASNYYNTGKSVDPRWGMIAVDHNWLITA